MSTGLGTTALCLATAMSHARLHAGPPNARFAVAAVKLTLAAGPDQVSTLTARQRIDAKVRAKRRFSIRTRQAASTLLRVAFPTVLSSLFGLYYFDNIALYIRSVLDVGTIGMLMADDAQFVQNFLTVIGLLFSILAGNAYSALYQQQEAIYFALFQEVSEAKSLLEQTTLVCQGRPFYPTALKYIELYVRGDLRRLDIPPAKMLASKPVDDPLESIMYITSVGVPSVVYETVKNLRQARGYRLGAMQRKFPSLGIGLLYVLAAVELFAFPLLGAGTASSAGILSLQSILFGFLCGAHILVLRIIQELWQPSGGVFNVDEVLDEMVSGLEEELRMRSEMASSTSNDIFSPPDNSRNIRDTNVDRSGRSRVWTPTQPSVMPRSKAELSAPQIAWMSLRRPQRAFLGRLALRVSRSLQYLVAGPTYESDDER